MGTSPSLACLAYSRQRVTKAATTNMRLLHHLCDDYYASLYCHLFMNICQAVWRVYFLITLQQSPGASCERKDLIKVRGGSVLGSCIRQGCDSNSVAGLGQRGLYVGEVVLLACCLKAGLDRADEN